MHWPLAYKVLVIMACLAVGFGTGANDAANAMGTAIGAGVRTIRKGALLVAVFSLLGATVQGHTMSSAVSEGLIVLAGVPASVALPASLASYMAAGLWILFTTNRGLPTSTAHSLVGSMMGAGLAAGRLPIDWGKIALLAAAWLVTPAVTAILSCAACNVLRIWAGRERRLARLWSVLLSASGAYMAYAWGAAAAGVVAGPLLTAGAVPAGPALTIGALSLAAGAMVWGGRVMTTVGRELVPMVPSAALAAESASALAVHACAILGLPVSSSHAIVGGVAGVGLAKLGRYRNRPARWRKAFPQTGGQRSFAVIIAFWAATPPACMALAWCIAKLAMMAA